MLVPVNKVIAWYSPSCGGFWLKYESIPAHIIANGVLPLGHMVAERFV